jgi:rubredoxin
VSNYRCPECSYVYSEESGDKHEGYPPGTSWASLPDDFVCPDCAVRRKEDFELL